MRKIFTNAKVYTAANSSHAEAFVVGENRFLFVGSNEEVQSFVRDVDEVVDLQGARVIPGMIDTHCHYLAICAANMGSQIAISEEASHEEVLEQFRRVAEENSIDELPLISGIGYGIHCKPTAAELDRAVSDRPVLLLDSGGHSGWMNSKMIELAGIDKTTPDPKPGASFFARDENGVPTGQIVEVEAMVYVQSKTGLANTKNLADLWPHMTKTLHSLGYVAAYDAGILFLSEREALEILSSQDSTIQLFTSFYFNGKRPVDEFLSEMLDLRARYANDWIHPATLKMFKDGTLEVFSALMYEEYCAPGSGKGEEMLSSELTLAMAKAAAENGFNVHVHAIGDRAIDETLDVFDVLGHIEGTKTMAHVQVLPEKGVERFTACGDVFYQTTPVWLHRDEFTYEVLGEPRYSRQMPLRSLAENGVVLCFGSDAPVSGGARGMDPFLNMYSAVCRGVDSETFIPPLSEGISIEASIDAYTINAAAQLKAEEEIGSIEAGKKANFVVLNQDILEIDSVDIKTVKPRSTWSEGVCVFRSNE
ncbi:MAG: amidohydrolase [Raoultibacter sp.]|jgi:predicted amidohydrolase YtcJ